MSDLDAYYVLSLRYLEAAVNLLLCVCSKLNSFNSIFEMKLY